jgi:C_GCAxxG_C_C family probable redox protein
MTTKNIFEKFDDKIKELEEYLPKLNEGVNCAELTLTSVLDTLGIDNGLSHNISIPLAGGFGGYKSKNGWQGPCGAVSGGCAAIGAIIGGKNRMKNDLIPVAYLKASKFASNFEEQFGSVVCSELCGYDFSDPNGFMEYRENNIWEKKCYKFVIWAVNEVRKLSKKDLKKKWT